MDWFNFPRATRKHRLSGGPAYLGLRGSRRRECTKDHRWAMRGINSRQNPPRARARERGEENGSGRRRVPNLALAGNSLCPGTPLGKASGAAYPSSEGLSTAYKDRIPPTLARVFLTLFENLVQYRLKNTSTALWSKSTLPSVSQHNVGNHAQRRVLTAL